jgi:cystathionine beta-lyase/cystathionine gamma-synthase
MRGSMSLPPRVLPDLGIAVSPCDLTDPDAVRAALRPNTRLIHAETPCNPILRLTDLAALRHDRARGWGSAVG